MQAHNWVKWKPLKIVIAFLVLMSGCQLGNPFLAGPGNPANVEVVVPKEENPGVWALAPKGDKIVYKASLGDLFLLTLETQQKLKLDVSCYDFGWLDNNLLWCTGDSATSFMTMTDNLAIIFLKGVDLKEMPLERALATGKIYRDKKDNRFFLVIHPDYENNPADNYYITVPDANTALQGQVYTTLPSQSPATLDEKVYAPNEAFYYKMFVRDNPGLNNFIAIYEAGTDKQLTEFGIDDPYSLDPGGWDQDSSSVYFRIIHGGMMGDPRIEIDKLKVPDEE